MEDIKRKLEFTSRTVQLQVGRFYNTICKEHDIYQLSGEREEEDQLSTCTFGSYIATFCSLPV